MRSGIVQWISEKGYGMIQSEDGKFVFVDANKASTLKKGQRVHIEAEFGSAGLIVKNIELITASTGELLQQSV